MKCIWRLTEWAKLSSAKGGGQLRKQEKEQGGEVYTKIERGVYKGVLESKLDIEQKV